MKAFSKLMVLSAVVVIVGGITAPGAMAAPIPETSFLTVTEPLDVGGTVLQPGRYVIRVLPKNANRNFLQVTNEDLSEIYATVLSVPHPDPVERDDTNFTEFVYYPPTENSPRALRTWFAADPVSGGGHDIVYPEGRAMQLATGGKAPVVAYKDAVEPDLETVELEVVNPEKKVVKYVAPKPVAPKPAVKVVPVRELPRTASRTPLMGLLGFLMIGAALVVRSIRIA